MTEIKTFTCPDCGVVGEDIAIAVDSGRPWCLRCDRNVTLTRRA
jgi:hypothetical protein